MNGALPPSSSDSFLIVGAHLRHQQAADFGRAGERQLAHDGAGGQLAADGHRVAGHDVEHAGGSPACCASTASASAVSGVCSAGLTTTVQPAASAGATLRVIIASGKFHGVIAAQTPIGCLMVSRRLSAADWGMLSP
jgi:hypothetical protein